MDDLDNITIQAHVQIDKFKLVDPRNQALKEPITIKIPTSQNQQKVSPPKITVNEPMSPVQNTNSTKNPVSPLSPSSPKPMTEVNNQPVMIASAPKIIKSSVGRKQTVPQQPIPEQRESQGTAAQLNAIKNQMKMKVENNHVQKVEVVQKPAPKPVISEPEWPKVIPQPIEDKSPKRVEFSTGLGTVEDTNQSVKEWSDTPERKSANIMAEIRKKISKKQKEEDKKETPEQKEIQVRDSESKYIIKNRN